MNYYFYEVIIGLMFLLFGIKMILKLDNIKLCDLYKFPLKIALIIVLALGIFIRIYGIHANPSGIDTDEISIGYESYAIANYGIDRNGKTLPVHLESWGCGQNALYAYLSIPFVKLFGLSMFSTRIVMSIVGIITLLISVYLIKKMRFKNDYISLVAIFLLVINPWHFSKSRWSLESNLFPDMIFMAMALVYLGKTKKRNYIFASIVLGLSAYSYGTSYLFLPLFTILLFSYLIIKKEIRIRDAILYLLIIGIISMPIIIFVIINYFKLKSFNFLGMFNIPILASNRMEKLTNLSGFNILGKYQNNLMGSYNLFINPYDTKVLNSVGPYGLFYSFSLPFILIGMIYSFKKNNHFMHINTFVFIAAIGVCSFVEPNINRINVLWVSILIYLIYGVIEIALVNRKISYGIILCYGLAFIGMTNYYNGKYDYELALDSMKTDNVIEVLNYTKKRDFKEMYITNAIPQNYIFYLFTYQINPSDYAKNVVKRFDGSTAYTVFEYQNVKFYTPRELNKGSVYVMNYSELKNFDTSEFRIRYFKNYVVVY